MGEWGIKNLFWFVKSLSMKTLWCGLFRTSLWCGLIKAKKLKNYEWWSDFIEGSEEAPDFLEYVEGSCGVSFFIEHLDFLEVR